MFLEESINVSYTIRCVELIFNEISLASILQIVIVKKYVIQNYHKILYYCKI